MGVQKIFRNLQIRFTGLLQHRISFAHYSSSTEPSNQGQTLLLISALHVAVVLIVLESQVLKHIFSQINGSARRQRARSTPI